MMTSRNRHGIIEINAYPILRPSQLKLNLFWRENNVEEVNDFTFWLELLNSTLDHYDKTIISMSERIMAYKRKLITEKARTLGIEWGRGATIDDILWMIHDQHPDSAVFIHQRIAGMEEELNAIYNFKKTIVEIVNELLLYQHYFYTEQNVEMAQMIKALHEARRDAHFWKGLFFGEAKSHSLMTQLFYDSITKQKA